MKIVFKTIKGDNMARAISAELLKLNKKIQLCNLVLVTFHLWWYLGFVEIQVLVLFQFW